MSSCLFVKYYIRFVFIPLHKRQGVKAMEKHGGCVQHLSSVVGKALRSEREAVLRVATFGWRGKGKDMPLNGRAGAVLE